MSNDTPESASARPTAGVERMDFTQFATRVSQVQGLPTTDNLQIDELSETLSAALDVLAHEHSIAQVVHELEVRKATRPPRT